MINGKVKARWLVGVCVVIIVISTRKLTPRLRIKYEECVWACPKHIRPVCGSNGKLYLNKCVFELDNCKKGGNLTFQKGNC